MRGRSPGLLSVYRAEQFVYDDPLQLIGITTFVRKLFRRSTVQAGGTQFGTDKFLH